MCMYVCVYVCMYVCMHDHTFVYFSIFFPDILHRTGEKHFFENSLMCIYSVLLL